MKIATRTRTTQVDDVRTVKVITTKTITWQRIPSNWRLPCGCINPDIWVSQDAGQSECTDCGRSWWMMGATGFGDLKAGIPYLGIPYPSQGSCVMLDGKPQGAAVLVLTEAMQEPI